MTGVCVPGGVPVTFPVRPYLFRILNQSDNQMKHYFYLTGWLSLLLYVVQPGLLPVQPTRLAQEPPGQKTAAQNGPRTTPGTQMHGATEICDNGIDDDGDGYVDGYDSDCSTASLPACTAPATVAAFSIAQGWVTATSNGLACSQSPTVADMDGDGIPEIIVAAAGGAGYRIYKGNGSNLTKTTNDYIIPLFLESTQPPSQPAVADIDGDGTPELIAVGSGGFVFVFGNTGGNAAGSQTPTGTSGFRFRSSAASSFPHASPRVVDIDEDGTPEIVVGTDVFQFDFGAGSLTRVVA